MQTQRADLWTQWGEEKAGQTEKVTWHCTSMYKTDRYFPGSCCTGKKLSLVLCDDLEVWMGGGKGGSRWRGYMHNYDWFTYYVNIMCMLYGRKQHSIVKKFFKENQSHVFIGQQPFRASSPLVCHVNTVLPELAHGACPVLFNSCRDSIVGMEHSWLNNHL